MSSALPLGGGEARTRTLVIGSIRESPQRLYDQNDRMYDGNSPALTNPLLLGRLPQGITKTETKTSNEKT